LVQEEFVFIAQYPKIAQDLLKMSPPEIIRRGHSDFYQNEEEKS